MQMTATRLAVDTNMSGGQFKINVGAKLYSVLSDKLYSDKPRAILREYACNCLDIHTRAGTKTPFIISLPSRLDPSLSFRDFGTGLSPEDVVNLFCTYFASDKGGSNVEVGGFGLGCKAGFAYTDAFVVTSWHDGLKSIYTCFRASDGIPQVSHVSSSETDELVGLEVKIPVRDEDVYAFKVAAQAVLQWFPADSFTLYGETITKPKISVDLPDYLVVDNQVRNVVLMGPVAYEVDWSQVGLTMPTTIVPRFKVGDLDLPPSREHLSYDERTKAALRRAHAAITKSVCRAVLRRAYEMTPTERLDFKATLNPLRALFQEYHKLNKAKDRAAHPAEPKWGEFLLYRHENLIVDAPCSRYSPASGRSSFTVSRAFDISTSTRFNSNQQISRFNLVIRDVDDAIWSRLENNRMSNAVVIKTDISLNELRTAIPGAASYSLLSELPPLPIETKGKKPPVIYKRTGRHSWDEKKEFLTEGVYVPFTKRFVDDGFHKYLAHRLLDDVSVYGLTKTALKACKGGTFTRIDKYVDQRIKEMMADPNMRRAISAFKVHQEVQNNPIYRFARHYDLMPDLKAAIQALEADIGIVDVPAVITQLKKLPPIKDHYGVRSKLARAERKNITLKLILNFTTYFTPDQLAEIAKVIK